MSVPSSTMTPTALVGAVLIAAAFTLACGGSKPSKITSMCSVSWQDATCNFTNTGSGEGISCVTVKLKSRKTGATLESEPVCSGTLAAGTASGPQKFSFIGDVKAHCPGGVKDGCEMEIVTMR